MIRFLKSTTDRRLFWKTLLWPPQRRRDLVLFMKMSLRCVEWQQLQRLTELKKASSSSPAAYASLPLRGLKLRKWWYQRVARRVAKQAQLAAQIHPNWLGGVHFHMACFFSLAMSARLQGLPEIEVQDSPTPSWKLSRDESSTLADRAPAVLDASNLLLQLEDARQKVGKLLPKSLEGFKSLKLASMHSSRDIGAETHDSFKRTIEQVEKILEQVRKIPDLGKHLKWELIRHRDDINRLHWQKKITVRSFCRKVEGVLEDLEKKSLSVTDAKEKIGKVESLRREYKRAFSWKWNGRNAKKAEEKFEGLRKGMKASQDTLKKSLDSLNPPQESEQRKKLQDHLSGLESSIRDLDELHGLTTMLWRVRAEVGEFQKFLNEARAISELSRWACEHLSHAMRDVEGPFGIGTWKWMLNSSDLEALRAHDAFRVWGWVALLQEDITTALRRRPPPSSAEDAIGKKPLS